MHGRQQLFCMRRLSRFFIVLLALMMIATTLSAPARAQALAPQPCPDGTTSGSVGMVGAFATVDYARRTYEVAVELSGLNHRGIVGYDDDNDGIRERCEPSNGLGGFELELAVDHPSVIAVDSAVAGENLGGNSGRVFTCFQRHDDASHFAIGCASTGGGDGPQGSRTLAVITLRPVGNGVSNLRLEATLTGPLADDADVTVNHGGAITVTGAPVPREDGSTPGSRTPVDGTTTAAGPNGDATPRDPAASGTPSGSETPRDGTPDGDRTPEATPAGGGGGGASSQGGGDGGGLSAAGVMLWTLAGLGGVGAAGALGLAAMRWRGVL